jgi:hypothetical protein
MRAGTRSLIHGVARWCVPPRPPEPVTVLGHEKSFQNDGSCRGTISCDDEATRAVLAVIAVGTLWDVDAQELLSSSPI